MGCVRTEFGLDASDSAKPPARREVRGGHDTEVRAPLRHHATVRSGLSVAAGGEASPTRPLTWAKWLASVRLVTPSLR